MNLLQLVLQSVDDLIKEVLIAFFGEEFCEEIKIRYDNGYFFHYYNANELQKYHKNLTAKLQTHFSEIFFKECHLQDLDIESKKAYIEVLFSPNTKILTYILNTNKKCPFLLLKQMKFVNKLLNKNIKTIKEYLQFRKTEEFKSFQTTIANILKVREKYFYEVDKYNYILKGLHENDEVRHEKQIEESKIFQYIDNIKDRIRDNEIVSISLVSLENELINYILFTARSNNVGKLDYILIHEIIHKVATMFHPIYVICAGFEDYNEKKNIDNPNLHVHEIIDEVITDIYAVTIIWTLHKAGIFLIEDELISDDNIYNNNTNGTLKNILLPFLLHFNKEIKKYFIYHDKNTFFSHITKVTLKP